MLHDFSKMAEFCGIFPNRLIPSQGIDDTFNIVVYSCTNCFNDKAIQKQLKFLGDKSLFLLSKSQKKTYSSTYSFRSLPKLDICIEFAKSYMQRYPDPIDSAVHPLLENVLQGQSLLYKV
tara:strand:- start:77 stop:436 length:360 start_codon:yes stop_codon:yes gene_type:complete